VLLGTAALLASIVFERPRTYRTLPPPGAIEPPRIVTDPVAMEVHA